MTGTPTYPLPRFVYKILSAPTPVPLPTTQPVTDLDRKDGFVHLSTAAQVPTTASLFFADHKSLVILRVDTRITIDQGGVYRWVEGLPGCPHLYAPREGEWIRLPDGNVHDWVEVTRADGQSWEDVFKRLREKGWLVDTLE